ncbi:MAG TPA: bifunctional 4-hydroxy-2-oxoglutarate aldolase/2-dehydro-3-deoxy-phosphogluconate aldolase [Clostridia bacterium]|nr:bifunctional 4-hydroxy-2-oxoglutarate aldolase/2-dehydro-3-deoxy-phosphogluconate aldolase [Clostridia bacterium]
MNKQTAREIIAQVGIVPVVRARSAGQAMSAVEAICRGGIPIVEITMTVPGAVGVIRELADTIGSRVLVGAGTVLDAAMARECVEAGAQFLVSPGLDLETVQFAVSSDTLIMAGCLTPTEVITAWKAGADLVKVFPCGQVGGARYIKALRGPLPQVPLVPTGGVNLNTAAEFIQAGAAALGVGGELVDAGALEAGRPDVITENARKFVKVVSEARAQMQCDTGTATSTTSTTA